MGRYQLRDSGDEVIGEGSFATFDEAQAMVSSYPDLGDGWTLYQQIGGDWTPAQRDVVGMERDGGA